MKPTTQYNASNAWNVNLNNGNVNNNTKTNGNQVRLVSEFCQNPDSPAALEFLDFAASFMEAYFKCLSTKINNPNAAFYALRGLSSTINLAADVWTREYEIGRGIAFTVPRPVWREIFAATFRDRIVHDWVMIREEPVFESVFPECITANRKGMGTLYAIDMAQREIYRLTEGYTRNDLWIYTTDFQGFFMSIDKRILSKAVMALNKEHYKGRWPELLNKTFNQITFNCPQLKAARRSPESTWQKNIAPEKSLYSQDKWHGLAIGNLPSQWSACVIVMLALRIIQKYEVVDSIIDYMDDMIWLVKDKEKFLRTLPAIEKELKETLNITLHPRKRNLQHYTKGWKMVGGKGKNCRLYASDRTIHRAEAKLKYLRSVHDVEGTFRSVNSYFGILSKFSTYKFRKEEADKILKEFGREIYFNGQLTKCVLKKKYNTREQVKSTILRGRARTQTLNNLYENAA